LTDGINYLQYVVSMKAKPLSTLELEIMDVVWHYGACSIGDIVKQINKKRPLAYTTVATVVSRLVEKGAVRRNEEDYPSIYSPRLTKQNLSNTVAKTFITKFFNSFGNEAIASFAQSVDKLPKDKKDYLLKLLSEYEDKNT